MGCCFSKSKSYSCMDIRRMQNNNISAHHTSMYNCDGLIFRRGCPFCIEIPQIEEGRPLCDNDKISLQIAADGGSCKAIMLETDSSTLEDDGWTFSASYNDTEDMLVIGICAPPDAAIGSYELCVNLNGKKIGQNVFHLFFNPWCEDDDVYMECEDDREEYILNDSTRIYMGTEQFIVPKAWDLGQFEPGSIDAVIYLLKRIPLFHRRSPVDVSRHFSALINSNDDNGVVVGNWSGNYQDGVTPTAWNGSSDILGRYARSKFPVKYGQCWVFAGVLCSVLRCVGIPARCITNYASLHDTDGSLKWEIYLDSNFQPINTGGDSCWNFHCWNEAWMKRKDLDSIHNGWQVLDATPQERSGGLFRVGPASKHAIREAMIQCPYDVGFVYAEVNADKVFYLRQSDGSFKEYMTKSNELGKCVLTKAKLCDEKEIITHEYKKECGGESLMHSIIDEEHVSYRDSESRRDRKIKIHICMPSCVMMTDELTAKVSIEGLSSHSTTTVLTEITLMSYTGRNICKLFEESKEVQESECHFKVHVNRDKMVYSVMEEFPFIKVKVYCYNSHHDELGFQEQVIPVKTPDLEIGGIPKSCKVDSPISCRIRVLNTLNIPLTHAKLHLKFTDSKHDILKVGTIAPGHKFSKRVILVPRTVGLKRVYVSLESKECCGFSNCAQFKAVL